MGVRVASPSTTNTDQDIRAPLSGAGTAQTRMHALVQALLPATISFSFVQSLGSAHLHNAHTVHSLRRFTNLLLVIA